MYGIAFEAGCFIAEPACSVNIGVRLEEVGVLAVDIRLTCDFGIVSLWCDEHFDPIVLMHTG